MYLKKQRMSLAARKRSLESELLTLELLTFERRASRSVVWSAQLEDDISRRPSAVLHKTKHL